MDARQPRIEKQSRFKWRPPASVLLGLLVSACSQTPQLSCGDPFVAIHDIQGADLRSNLVDEFVQTEGVSTGWLYDEDGDLFGSFVEAHQPDTDTATSEGLLVVGPQLEAGHRYRLAGTVRESDPGMTTLEAVQQSDCGPQSLPPAQNASLPLRGRHIESLEGMRVVLDGPLVVSDVSRMGSHGEAVVAAGQRLYQPTEVAEPGRIAQQIEMANLRRSLVLDDFSLTVDRGQVPWWPDPAAGLPRAGAQIRGLEGVLDHRFGYRLHLTTVPQADVTDELPPLHPPQGDLRVASFNVLNLFNGDGNGGDFPTTRGAATDSAYQRQLVKIVAAMAAMQADIFALAELENDGFGPLSAVAQLTSALRKSTGRNYQYVSLPDGRIGGDAITVGLVFDAEVAEVTGPARSLTAFPFDDFNRPPLAQAFVHRESGKPVTTVALHLKSKGCGRAEGANQDQRDGQGCFNDKRMEAVTALQRWIDEMPDLQPATTLLIGDFNAYSREDPVRALINAGFAPTVQGDEPTYTYIYRGRAGALDHALAGATLHQHLRSAIVWHINADWSGWLDYRSAGSPLYGLDARRSSDHDPLVLDFDMTRSGR